MSNKQPSSTWSYWGLERWLVALGGQILFYLYLVLINSNLNRHMCHWTSLVTQTVKNLPEAQETRVQSLGQEDSLEKGMATHSNSLRPYGQQSARPFCPWDSPGKNTGVGCHFLLQGIFPSQGLNPCLLHQQAYSFYC